MLLPKVDKSLTVSKSIQSVKKIVAAVLTAGLLGTSSMSTIANELPSSDQNSPIMLVQHSLNHMDSYHYSHGSHMSHSSHRSHMSHYSSGW